MKNLALLLAAILLTFRGVSAQDPGAPDSVIMVVWYSEDDYVYIDIDATTDDSVAYYNIPLTWRCDLDGLEQGAGVGNYSFPINEWDVFYDSLVVDQHRFRLFGLNDILIDSIPNPVLLTNNTRTRLFTLRLKNNFGHSDPFVATLDTTRDPLTGPIMFGLVDGLTQVRPFFRPASFYVYGEQTGTDDPNNLLPQIYLLSQNYPNPFNPSTNIEFAISTHGHVALQIFDILGRNVRNLVDKNMEAGRYSVTWDGSNNSGQEVPSGMYFYKLASDNSVQTKKMLLIR